jgi:cardiolipin synthase
MFPAVRAAISEARRTICLECYIYAAGEPGEGIRDALIRAAERGVRVRVLVDGLGSYELPDEFWLPLRAAGGEVRVFNPISLRRLGIRDHRKLLVCDERVAFVGGFNIAPDYLGDGVTRGWRDLGLQVGNDLAKELAAAFEEMFARAEFQHKRFPRLRRKVSSITVACANTQLLLSGPGRGRNAIQRMLLKDLRHARDVRIVVPYFLPARRFRRAVARVARRGGKVQLILPEKSDVALSQLASQSLYRRLLRAGVEILEYEPQVLHAKLFVVDDVVYVGSCNLDPRSLSINYEVMLRFADAQIVAEAREIFRDVQHHCRAVRLEEWRKSRTFWERLKSHWAHFILTRVDPYVARRQWRALPD